MEIKHEIELKEKEEAVQKYDNYMKSLNANT